MSLDQTSFFTLCAGFLIFLIFSYYYLRRRHTWEGRIGLVFLSFLQGTILGILTGENFIFNMFVITVVTSILYYLFFSKLLMLIEYAKNKFFGTFVSFENHDLTEMMKELWDFPTDKLDISIYKGKNSFNAFTALSRKEIKIFVGENLLKEVSEEEIKFVLSHEIAHNENKRYFHMSIVFPIAYMIVCFFIIFWITLLGLLTVVTYFAFSAILYIIGVMIENRIYWENEYLADQKGFEKTKNLVGAEFLKRCVILQKDLGILNLLFYDHPSPQNRLNKLKNFFESFSRTKILS